MPPLSKSFGGSTVVVAVVVAATAAITSSVIFVSSCYYQKRKILQENQELQKEANDLRQEIQRIRNNNNDGEATVNNNNNKKQTFESRTETTREKQSPPDDSNDNSQQSTLTVKCVGTVRSIYRLCVGTPRQGLLAPNARGRIEMLKLGDTSAIDSLDGLQGYSHIWILFVFHLNTQSKNKQSKQRIKSKISPPALGGGKVGIYATRTPHRYNPIGITLCKLDSIYFDTKTKVVSLEVSGLDLVDGTPVLDIKPYVPIYDSVVVDDGEEEEVVKVPHWVAGGLQTKRRVDITDRAKSELMEILIQNPNALQFYGPKRGREQSAEETLNYVCDCITQVLAIDVRSNYQTKKSREGKFQAERSERLRGHHNSKTTAATTTTTGGVASAKEEGQTIATLTTTDSTLDQEDLCTQQLDNLLIHYKVMEDPAGRKRSNSEGSGAEDLVEVISIGLMVKSSSSVSST